MTGERTFADRDAIVRKYEHDDGVVVAADLGMDVVGSVDVVDGTAIVVVGDDQYDLEVPGEASRAFMNNGVVTVEVEA